ncbi:MAG: type II toxin-antitoxin system VapC family toxin [Lautropia sp.]|nr:type II toxin-antitoxin system VapC family toxin [Lautropia sp.]
MNLLPDTHVLLWMAFDDRSRLSPSAISLLEDPDNTLYFSLASLWEVSIKSSLGKADFDMDVMTLETGLREAGFLELSIRLPHILRSGSLPLLHRDPFDRLLLAQAEVEGMQLLTADRLILQYDSPHALAVS